MLPLFLGKQRFGVGLDLFFRRQAGLDPPPQDRDLRGRKPGDVANILCRAIREAAPATECEVILDEIEALRQAVSRMVKNEVIVLFYEKLQPIQTALQELDAQPVVALPPPVKQESPLRRLRPAVNRTRRFGKRLVAAMPPA